MSRRRVAAVVTIVALAAGAPLPARAQAPAPAQTPAPGPVQRVQEPVAPVVYDTVVLRDGTILRGTILELHPEREVIIALATGTRTIAWQDLSSAQFAGAPAVVPEGPAPAPAPSEHVPQDSNAAPPVDEVAPGPSRPRIFIELTRPADVHLFEGTPPEMRNSRSLMPASRSVCRAPCGRVIDGSEGYPFFFGGDRVASSRQFLLKDHEGDYVAHVKPGRRGLLFGGFLMSGYGFAGSLAGSTLLLVSRDREVRTAGGVVLGAALALLIAGVTMAIHGTTRYRLERRR